MKRKGIRPKGLVMVGGRRGFVVGCRWMMVWLSCFLAKGVYVRGGVGGEGGSDVDVDGDGESIR